MADTAEHERRIKLLRAAHRVVVKIGTRVVGAAEGEAFEALVASLAEIKNGGRQVVLVSSGAVGLGAARLKVAQARLGDVTMRQACAAIGQSLLMRAYERLFREHGVVVAQILLTEADFTDHRRYLNLRRTMEKLLKLGVLPIVNENDTVSTAELEYLHDQPRVFSDNDRLAALVMSKLEADALLILSNVDGLLGAPDADGARAVVPFVGEMTAELKSLAAGPAAGGRGGMRTKLEAAEIAMRAGGIAVIANGDAPHTLERVLAGESVGTVFVASGERGRRMPGKRRWIAYAAGVQGRLIVNEGARRALLGGKASLLSSGVIGTEGSFEAGEVVAVTDADGREFARGIANCSRGEFEARARGGAEQGKAGVLITRDNIVVYEEDAFAL